jgi:gamma-glutamyl-gamma-aminobutyrate hydrolase PuuD
MTCVGITQRTLPPTEHGEQRYALDLRWYEFLAECGLTPVPLPNDPDIAAATAATAGVRGLILSGGDDLADYGGPFPRRDETELRLLDLALCEGLPVLGVCRGMQLLLHAFGGTLSPVDGHVATRHDVRTARGVRTVNSFHALAAAAVPDQFEVTATCGADVEAVRHRDAPVVGVMWHAEREDPFDEADVAQFRTFFGGS